MNTDDDDIMSKEQLKHRSGWIDSIFGHVRTDEWDSFYENLPTKLSRKFHNNIKFSKLLKKLYKIHCEIIGPFHVLPDFLILGSGACGTTSMLELYLRSHKDILPSKINEIMYFNHKHTNSVNWYKSLFPSIIIKKFRTMCGKKTLTCEASGNYILDPYAPKRIKKIMPDIKFIVMLRNPTDRTLSQYKRRIRIKREKRSIEEVFEYELNNFEKEFGDYIKNEESVSFYPFTSYLADSRYFQQIDHWFEYFPKEQFLFINSNEYFRNPLQEYNRILKFLDLPSHYPKIKGKRGISPPGLFDNIIIKSETLDFLNNYFSLWNKKLFNLIGIKFNWEDN